MYRVIAGIMAAIVATAAASSQPLMAITATIIAINLIAWAYFDS